jgi:diadenylate cyclase
MFWNYLTLLKELQWGDLLDIGLASSLIWFGLHALRTGRTRRIGIGLLIYSAIILAANQLELKLTVWILQGITAVIILVVVVVYQSEIRRLLERFPASLFYSNRMSHAESSGLADLLINVLELLANERRGALIVLPGNAPLDGVVTAGTLLDGRVSKTLLLSIFDPNSPGHDGALVLWGNRVERFGSRLPLSDQDAQLKDRGTRHAAALGLSEKTDAMVLVVSEETGGISVAREGRLQPFPNAESLHREIESFLERHSTPVEKTGRLKSLTVWGGLECLGAVVAAAVLWLVLVPGSVVQTATYEVAVEVQNIPEGFALTSVTPPQIAVTLTGEKRNLFKIKPDELLIRLDGTLTRFGRQTYPITSAHLLLPPDVDIADLTPEQVRVLVRKLN